MGTKNLRLKTKLTTKNFKPMFKLKSMSIIFKRLIPYLVPFLTFVGLELAFTKPSHGWIFLLVIFTIGLASFIFITKEKFTKKTAQLILPGILFLFNFIVFFLFLTLASGTFKHIFAIIISLLLGLTLEIIFQLFHNQQPIKNYANFFSYLNLLTIFMLFSFLGSANIFLGISNWLLFLIAAVLSLGIFYSNFYTASFLINQTKSDLTDILNQKIENLINQSKAQKILFTFIPALILIEIFWALSFLPTSFYINSFILTICYYVISGLAKNRLSNNLNKTIIKKYILVGGVCLLLIIFTARI